jgi:hypothetical protein
MKTIRKALERAAKALKTQTEALAEIKAAIVRLEVIESANEAQARCLVELRSFVEYCEALPGRSHAAAFDSRVKRARHALDKLTGGHV